MVGQVGARHHPDPVSRRAVAAPVGGGEHGEGGHTETRREVNRSCVAPDHRRGPRQRNHQLLEVGFRSELDRSIEPDHLTCLYVPELGAPVGREIVRLWELTRTLRLECPWDREQTHQSLRPHLLEEAHEVLEAIDHLDVDGDDHDAHDGMDHLEEELGDLLFQVVIHSVLGAETGAFDLSDVARGIHDKLRSRHPHVFGDVSVETTDELVGNWERIKRAEKGRESVVDGIPSGHPALQHAAKVLRKGGRVGLETPDQPTILGGLTVELSTLRDPDALDEDRLGELLLSIVALAATVDVDPEGALRVAAGRLRDEIRVTDVGVDDDRP